MAEPLKPSHGERVPLPPSSFDVPPPFERLPFQYTGGGLASLSEEQRAQLRDAIFRLLDNTITFTFSPHLGGLNKVSNEIPGMAAGEFAELQARDARRWNAVMARLGLDVAV